MKRISIIIPVLNEAARIEDALTALQPLRRRGHEIIVVDGGSTDKTVELAAPLADQVLTAMRGRARQMNAGAAKASGNVLLFLHADTRLPPDADQFVEVALAPGLIWGRFDVQFDTDDRLLRLVAWSMNLRSRLSGVATGDQAIFIKRESFETIGGYPEIDLMEDLALSDKLLKRARPVCLRVKVTTSARRWQERGRIRTILLMWWLRLRYRLGADPGKLARRYGYE